ncbi:WD40 repeat-like protein [Russula earlei]|uniref:WD40 repeat-like protein n=1 Tax=Russula earlei TaxID=71964 RepID=A0ACC0UKU4_9AGAM|nr:WD40 repeat-like protein [Russula earlei]
MESQYVWKPPSFDTCTPPSLVHEARLLPQQNFARSAKWCPDGSLALAHCENRSLQYLDMCVEQTHLESAARRFFRSGLCSFLSLCPALDPFDPPKTKVFPRPAPILDFAWYPRATPRDPSSFCFVASVRESPVQLLDASDGRLRASYKIVDHRERQIGPHSVSFNYSADKLYCGFEDAVEVFDINNPGQGTRLATTPSKKSRDGLKGIISALAFCPSYDPSYRLYAAGSLSPSSATSVNIALFDEDTGEKPVGWIGDIKASVMQLAFNPVKSHVLYASFRRRDEIYGWDLRGSTVTPLQIFRRGDGSMLETNQKIKFDLDIGGDWMGVGDQNGNVNMFNLATCSAGPTNEVGEALSCGTGPVLKYRAHDDAVGSVAFHPVRPLLLSVSGSRHFDDIESEGEESAEETSRGDGGTRVVRLGHCHRPRPKIRDNSLRLWHAAAPST